MARDNARSAPWWRWCVRVLLVACALAVLVVGVANVVTVATTRDRVVTVEGAASALAGDPADAVVVLGASVYADGTPSDILADRLEVACDLYKAGAARAIIVSGDNRTSHYNESDAMKAYCVELGVPSEDVYVDHAGNTTYESMWRARHVFGAERIVVATQAYHLYRAMFAADCLGMQGVGRALRQGGLRQPAGLQHPRGARPHEGLLRGAFAPAVDTAGEAVSLNDSGDLT